MGFAFECVSAQILYNLIAIITPVLNILVVSGAQLIQHSVVIITTLPKQAGGGYHKSWTILGCYLIAYAHPAGPCYRDVVLLWLLLNVIVI